MRDTGIGITKERQESLFIGLTQRESSATSCFGVTGIGLGLAKGAVELMGVRIWVKSIVGNGSVLLFTTSLGRAMSGPGSSLFAVEPVAFSAAESLPGTAHMVFPRMERLGSGGNSRPGRTPPYR